MTTSLLDIVTAKPFRLNSGSLQSVFYSWLLIQSLLCLWSRSRSFYSSVLPSS